MLMQSESKSSGQQTGLPSAYYKLCTFLHSHSLGYLPVALDPTYSQQTTKNQMRDSHKAMKSSLPENSELNSGWSWSFSKD